LQLRARLGRPRLAARVPELDIFSQGLIERLNGGWRISEKGRAILAIMEARPSEAEAPHGSGAVEEPPAAARAGGAASAYPPAAGAVSLP
jgi:hypothetical protein